MIPQSDPMNPVASPVGEQKLPGKVGIWIGSLLILGGTIQIDDAGKQSIYAERAEGRGGASFTTSTNIIDRPDITVRVIGPNGEDVPVSYSGASETYTFDGREGVLVGTFRADEPGEYQIRTVISDGMITYTQLAIGEGMVLGGVFGILGGVFGGGLVVLLGIIVLIISLVRRSGAKRRRNQASSPYGSGPYGGAPPGGWAAPPGYAPPAYGQPSAYGQPPAYGQQPPAGQAGAPGWAPPPVPPAPPATGDQGWPPPPPVS